MNLATERPPKPRPARRGSPAPVFTDTPCRGSLDSDPCTAHRADVGRRWMRIGICFLLLPLLPGLALFLPARHIPVFRDRIVVGVLVGSVVALVSAALARAAGGGVGKAVLYGVATAGLAVIAFAIMVAITLTVGCGNGGSSC